MILSIGEIVRSNRERLDISQEDLCYGICSVSNLSRIENGTQIPSRITYEAFMQRMGLSPDVYQSFRNDRELIAHKLKHEISECVGNHDYGKAEELINKLEKQPKLDKLYYQYINYVRALIFRHMGGDPAQGLVMMKKVLGESIKDFEQKNFLRLILTKEELFMLCHYAIALENAGDINAAIEVLYNVKDYIERKVVETAATVSAYTMIVYTLSRYLLIKNKHKEALELCDIGINFCIKYGKLYDFADIIYNKGYALIKLGRIDEATKYIQEAYYITRASSRTLQCNITKNLAEKYGITI